MKRIAKVLAISMTLFVSCAFSIPAQVNALDYQSASANAVQVSQEAKAASTSSKSKVWIPKTGKKYHRYKSCSKMKGPRKVTLKYAKSHGYKACKKCYK